MILDYIENEFKARDFSLSSYQTVCITIQVCALVHEWNLICFTFIFCAINNIFVNML